MNSRQLIPRRKLSRIAAGGVIVAAVSAALFWLAWRDDSAPVPKVIANNVSGRTTACLAADSTTARQTDTVTNVWTAMQHTAAADGKNVQQLIVPASNLAQTQPLLSGLISQRCDLVITIGQPFGQAITAMAKNYPSVQFTAIDSALTTSPPNTTLLSSSDTPTGAVQQEIQNLNKRLPSPAPTHR